MTFEDIAPYLSERGRLEIDLAAARWQVDQLTAENAMLRASAEEGAAAAVEDLLNQVAP